MLNNAGPRSTNLQQNMVIKLKAVYTSVEQLYTGSQRALAVVALSNDVPYLLQDVLKRLATKVRVSRPNIQVIQSYKPTAEVLCLGTDN